MFSLLNRNHRSGKKALNFRLFFLILCSVFFLFMIGVGIYLWRVDSHLPEVTPQALSSERQSSMIFDKDGNKIAELHGEENRSVVSTQDIPDLVKKSFIAVEDKRFYQHGGIDLIRIIKSAFNDLTSGTAKEGGSTITVQLARNTFIEDPTAKTLTRKVQEALLAIDLEHHFSKEEILTYYLNKIYLGELSYGIESAAKIAFDVLDELFLGQPRQVFLKEPCRIEILIDHIIHVHSCGRICHSCLLKARTSAV